jgi:D-threo-aldose 1-dehydrogenase
MAPVQPIEPGHGAAAQWPTLGLGCASLGSPAVADRDAQAVMEAAMERGIRLFDVAPLYGGGLAEERLGRALRALPRDSYVLSTKTGVTRPYGQPPTPTGSAVRRGADVWDYGASATRSSIQRSLERLNVDRLDVVHLHDVEDHIDECLVARDTLAVLREQGFVDRIGIGSNLVAPVLHLLERAQFDAILLAGCYTLLNQEGDDLLHAASHRGIKVLAGGIFNSGILAVWPQEAPTFGYEAAGADARERTARIAAVCQCYGVPIAAAAIQFVQAHAAVATTLIGPRSVRELDENLAARRQAIPAALWAELEAAGLIPSESQRTVAGPAHAAAQ